MAAAARLDSQESGGSYMYDDDEEGDLGFGYDDDDDDDDGDFLEDEGSAGMDEGGDDDDDETAVEMNVLTPRQLLDFRIECIREVNEILKFPPSTARGLMAHFKWDKEQLLNRFYGEENHDKLFADAHVVNPAEAEAAAAAAAARRSSGTVSCEVCMDDYRIEDMAGLDCKHIFCAGCWSQYLHTKIMEEGTQDIRCPHHGCDIRVDDLSVRAFMKDPETLRKYEYLLAKAFVQRNRHIKWCPAPGCENAIELPTVRTTAVACECGHVFCFGCQQPSHRPVHCEMLRIWLKKCSDDSETANWISANTKECPKCKSIIEKNGGCNHMTCRSASCKYEFCWVCLAPWEPHGSSWYNCNQFNEKAAKEAQSAQEKSRFQLERYLHYFKRYANHDDSCKLEGKLRAMVEKKQKEMQKNGMTWIEVQFLSKALDVLRSCRGTLKYTYVFAYYLKKNNECVIFEANQKDLEMATETLSEYLEGKAKDAELSALRQMVMDKTKYCEKRRHVLLEHVREGVAGKKWDFQPEEVRKEMVKAYGW